MTRILQAQCGSVGPTIRISSNCDVYSVYWHWQKVFEQKAVFEFAACPVCEASAGWRVIVAIGVPATTCRRDAVTLGVHSLEVD